MWHCIVRNTVYMTNNPKPRNMNTFFDDSGCLNIDELIQCQPSFRRIMADGIVTEDELSEQSSRVTTLLKEIERTASSGLIEKIRELLAEMSVLIAARHTYEQQETQD